MKIWQALFGAKKVPSPTVVAEPTSEGPEDILQIARLIGPLLDETANEIIRSYRNELLAQPITYIVPAVWGAVQEGELSALQKEIHQQVQPEIERIITAFGFGAITKSQAFAVGYVVRGLIISKVTYMVETLRNECLKQDKDLLSRLDPVGKA